MDEKDQKITALEARIVALENLMRSHQHQGADSALIDAEDIFGLFGVPDTGVPFGIQRSTDGTRYRLWLFPIDEIFLAPLNGITVVRGLLAPFASTDDMGTALAPWDTLHIQTVQFKSRNVTSLSAGQMAYHDNAGTQQFRANAGGFFGSIDLTGV